MDVSSCGVSSSCGTSSSWGDLMPNPMARAMRMRVPPMRVFVVGSSFLATQLRRAATGGCMAIPTTRSVRGEDSTIRYQRGKVMSPHMKIR